MAKVQSSFELEDKMSSKIDVIVDKLTTAQAKLDITQSELNQAKFAQQEWAATMDAANKIMTQNAQAMELISKKLEETTNRVKNLDVKEQKLIKIILHHEEALHKLKEQQENTRRGLEETNQKLEKQEKMLTKTQSKIITLSAAFQLLNQAVGIVKGIYNAIDNLTQKTQAQVQAEDKLAIVTKNRMGLTDQEVRSLYNLASAQQKVGIVGDEAQLAGMANMASFVKQKGAIDNLTPAMNNLAVKMQGYNVNSQGTEQAARVLSMAMKGQTTALRRMGVVIDDNTKKRLMAMDEEKRSAELAKIITGVTGDLNKEMAKTPFGKMAQANNQLSDSYEKIGAALVPLQATMIETWSNIVGFIADNLGTIVPIVTSALAVMTVGLIALKWEAIEAAMATVAEWAAVATPFLIIIGVIGTLSVAFNLMGISFSEQAKNIIISCAWIITSIQNVGIWFQNVWTLGVNAVRNFKQVNTMILAGFFSWVLGKLQKIAEIFDKVFKTGISESIGKLSSDFGKIEKMSEDEIRKNFKGEMKGYKDNSLYANEARADAFMSKLSGGIAGINRALAGAGGMGIPNDLMTTSDGGKALKTKNQGKIEIKEEDIKLLHDLATKEYAINYQQTTPQITIPNMVIHETADIDALGEQLISSIIEASESSLNVGVA